MNIKLLSKSLPYVAVCLFMTACSDTPNEKSKDSDLSHYIILDTIRESPFELTFATAGTIRAEAGKLAEIAMPMDGRIAKTFVSLGNNVSKGTPLFSISSPNFAELCKQYFQAEANCTLQEKEYSRKLKLHSEGVVSKKELDEAETNLELARKEYSQWQSTMDVFGIDRKSLKSDGAMVICSPINGEVVRLEANIGQYVKSDSPAPVTIANLESVWVTAQLKEYYINRIHENDSVEVLINSDDNYHIAGNIVYIGKILNPDTRSAEVIVECSNADKRLKPGMFAHVHFTAKGQQAIQIPATAVMQGEDNPFVYVTSSNGKKYEKRSIVVESADSGMMRVISGLEIGEVYVAKGSLYLK